MSDSPQTPETPDVPDGIPSFLDPVGRAWAQTSGRLVPVFAVITAFLMGIPLMIITAGDFNVSKGLSASGSAYEALIEGGTGLASNKIASVNDFTVIRQYAQSREIEATGISRQSRPFENVATIGVENLRSYENYLNEYSAIAELEEDDIEDLSERIQTIRDTYTDPDDLRAVAATLELLEAAELSSGDVGDIAEIVAGKTSLALTQEEIDAVLELWPSYADLQGEQLETTLEHLTLINDTSYVGTQRNVAVLALLDSQEIGLRSDDADTIVDLAELGLDDVNEGIVDTGRTGRHRHRRPRSPVRQFPPHCQFV